MNEIKVLVQSIHFANNVYQQFESVLLRELIPCKMHLQMIKDRNYPPIQEEANPELNLEAVRMITPIYSQTNIVKDRSKIIK